MSSSRLGTTNPAVPRSTSGFGFVPHFLPGQNPYIDEFAIENDLPIEATRGGPETTRPDYREKMKTMKRPSETRK